MRADELLALCLNSKTGGTLLTIASRTGWSEEHIRWDLPLSRCLAYYHGVRLMEGDRCRWPQDRGKRAAWADSVREKIRSAVATAAGKS